MKVAIYLFGTRIRFGKSRSSPACPSNRRRVIRTASAADTAVFGRAGFELQVETSHPDLATIESTQLTPI